MPFTPSSAAQNTAALAGSNLANLAAALTGMQTSILAGNLGPAALIDAIMSGVAYQAQDVGPSLTNPAQVSTSFIDVGNGTTTGWAPATFNIPIAKTYLVSVDLGAWLNTAAGVITFQLVNTTTSTNYTNSGMQLECSTSGVVFYKSFRVPVAMNAGNNTLKLQWKASNGTSILSLDSATARTFTITG